jgi:hypothetical protein
LGASPILQDVKQIKKLLIAIFIAPLLVSSLAIPSTAATDSAEVLLELVTPYAPIGRDTVLFQGTYRNKTNSNLTNLSLKLLLSDPIVNRSALNTALNSPLPTELTARGQEYKVGDLKPGAIAPFSIGINAAQLLSKGPGAYLAGFQLASGKPWFSIHGYSLSSRKKFCYTPWNDFVVASNCTTFKKW